MTTETTHTSADSSSKKLAIGPRERLIVSDSGPLANLFDSARFEHLQRIATLMAGATLIPDHLWKDKNGPLDPSRVVANCFLVVNQAVRWQFDPFAVAPCTYSVGGKLAFEGKLVAAVINARAPIENNLDYAYTGTKGKDDYTVSVSATIIGEIKPRTITLSVGDAKTDNRMWTKDPEQKLAYSGATKWARRHCPEVILGVLTDDDLESTDHQGFDNAKSVNYPVKPAFMKKAKSEPETTAADAVTVTASEILTPDKAASASQESLDRSTTAESAKTVTGPYSLKEAPQEKSHEVIAAQEASATTKEPGQQASVATPPASDDPASPLRNKIYDAMKTYDLAEDIIIAFAKGEQILSKGNRMKLEDITSDNILKLIVNALPKLIAKHNGAGAP